MKKITLSILFVLLIQIVIGQNMPYARQVIDTLTSSHFWGRGYTKDGMKKAADYIAAQLAEAGVKPLNNKDFLQKFSYPVNTFPGKMELTINDKQLVPGRDYIVGPQSNGKIGKGTFEKSDSLQYIDQRQRVIVKLEDKLTWSISNDVADYTLIIIKKSSLTNEPKEYEIKVEQKLETSFKAFNVCGIVKGTTRPDSVVVFTAHYDHLGGMGDATFFPGANDNASGISMLLNLAKYYAANPQPYSIAFIAFAGEEAGLVGSKYFVENPLVPLKSIRFLLNVDLVGTGDEGITVVNASEFANEFALLNKINNEHKLLTAINARGKAANSDHYWFTEKGVPAFFMYTLGGIKAYHDVFDRSTTLPLNEYNDLLRLVVLFNEKLMQ